MDSGLFVFKGWRREQRENVVLWQFGCRRLVDLDVSMGWFF